MTAIVVLMEGACAPLLYTIVEEIRRERAFRRRNRVWMAAGEASPHGVRAPATQGTTTGTARSSGSG
jgi:hypothetical protein